MPWGAGTAAILLRVVAGPVLARRDQAVLGGIDADHRVSVVAVEVATGAGRGVLEHLDAAEVVAEALVGPIERLALSLRGAPQDLAGLAHLGRRVLHPVAQHLLVERPRAPHVEHQGEVAPLTQLKPVGGARSGRGAALATMDGQPNPAAVTQRTRRE